MFTALSSLLLVGLLNLKTTKLNAIEECSDVLFLYMRSSAAIPGSKKNEFEGGREDDQKNGKVYSETLKSLLPDNVTVKSESLNYPAYGSQPGIWLTVFGGDAYWKSKDTGTNMLTNRINYESGACPSQQIVVAGYSQGAHAAGDAMYNLATPALSSKLSYVSLFGDPTFNPDSWAAIGDYKYNKNFRSGGLITRRSEFSDIFRGRLESWCLNGDGFCSNKVSGLGLFGMHSEHGNYADKGIVKSSATRAAKAVLEKYNKDNDKNDLLKRLPEEDVKRDIVFVVDKDDTMTESFINIRDKINTLRDHAVLDNPNTRIGVVRVREHRYDNANKLYMPYIGSNFELKTGVDYFRQELIASDPTGTMYDSDYESQTLTGIDHALNNMRWRDDARKYIVVLTAQPFKTPEYFTKQTEIQIANKAAKYGVSIDVLLKRKSSDNVRPEDFSELTNRTNGKVVTWTSNSKAAETVGDAMNNLSVIPALPQAKKVQSYPGAVVDFEIPLIYPRYDLNFWSYDWNFNEDEIYDKNTTEPKVAHVFDNEYKGYVGVRATSGLAHKTYGTIPVDISWKHKPTYNTSKAFVIDISEGRRFFDIKITLPEFLSSTGKKESSWIDSLVSKVFAIFNTPVVAAEPNEGVVGIYDQNSNIIGILPASGDAVRIPKENLVGVNKLGILLDNGVEQSEITFIDLPEEAIGETAPADKVKTTTIKMQPTNDSSFRIANAETMVASAPSQATNSNQGENTDETATSDYEPENLATNTATKEVLADNKNTANFSWVFIALVAVLLTGAIQYWRKYKKLQP